MKKNFDYCYKCGRNYYPDDMVEVIFFPSQTYGVLRLRHRKCMEDKDSRILPYVYIPPEGEIAKELRRKVEELNKALRLQHMSNTPD